MSGRRVLPCPARLQAQWQCYDAYAPLGTQESGVSRSRAPNGAVPGLWVEDLELDLHMAFFGLGESEHKFFGLFVCVFLFYFSSLPLSLSPSLSVCECVSLYFFPEGVEKVVFK